MDEVRFTPVFTMLGKKFKPVFGKVLNIGVDAPTYTGPTVVTPSLSSQSLATAGKLMPSDVTVEPVPMGSATTPNMTIAADVDVSLNSQTGTVTAAATGTALVKPNVVEGYVTQGSYGTVAAAGTGQLQLPVLGALRHYPTAHPQTIVGPGVYVTGNQILSGVTASNLTPGNIKKGVTVDIGCREYPDSVTSVTGTYEGEGGGTGSDVDEDADVLFIDYDGTPLFGYSADEFLSLLSLPPNPSHDGLVAQGWNWGLADAQAFVQENRTAVIGQMYTTDDSKTRVYVTIPETYKTVDIAFWGNNAATQMDIDWGDGTAHWTQTGVGKIGNRHTYAAGGDYVISVSVTGGTVDLLGYYGYSGFIGAYDTSSSSSGDYGPFWGMAKKVEIGSGVKNLRPAAFYNCVNLESISIPQGVGIASTLARNLFNYCSRLKAIVLPSGAANTYALASQFASQASALKYVSFPKVGVSSFTGDQEFSACGSLQRMVLPSGPTTLPSGVVGVGAPFKGIKRVAVPSGYTTVDLSSLTGAGHGILIKTIILPSTITELTGYSVLPILDAIHVKATTPPTLPSNALRSIQTDYKIYVPYSADHSVLNAYKNATNWSAYAAHIMEESQ